MKRSTLRSVTTTLALALLGGSASAATMMANNSNKGSILVFPRIDIRTLAADFLTTPVANWDTLITLVNDSSTNVQVKCYYRTSEPLPTPLSSKVDVSQIKHTMDFTFTLTRNQPITWSAATGHVLSDVAAPGPLLAQAFGAFPDGSQRQTGELKCFAIGADAAGNVGQINFNQLFGSATIVNSTGQAWQYNAWAFQALGGTAAQGQLVGTPGRIVLDGTIQNYDMCPNILVADFEPNGGPALALGNSAGTLIGGTNPTGFSVFSTARTSQILFGANTTVSIAGCSQDLTQVARPVITKYTYTFWNEDESSRTGSHECADSWYETYLPVFTIQGVNMSLADRIGTGAGASTLNPFTGAALPFTPTNNAGIGAMPLAQFSSLGTPTAYMRVESTPDPAVCFGAVQVGMLGVISHENQRVYVRGSNMIGRGTNASGVMTWTPGPADSFKK